ncbi:GTP-binding protein [Mycena galopus ATCC 62051]|nr:GTP-binding protein [Mycena galopus ATCC 62051]
MSSNVNEAIDVRRRISHFNVLVIGRANAGKTTLLKRVCDSIEDPEVFNPDGEKIDASVVEGTSERGDHDIENRLIFKSNPKFIFHDSRGFESGSVHETDKVKAFITERAASRELSEQLHVIWYCLPTDTNRPLLEADKLFFNNPAADKVPVIAIFTKFDALVTKAFAELKRGGATRQEATAKGNEKALEMLTADFVEPLKSTTFCPSHYLHLSNVQEAGSNSRELMEKTANALNNDALRLLFVSVQQNNIDLCIGNAVSRWVVTSFCKQYR